MEEAREPMGRYETLIFGGKSIVIYQIAQLFIHFCVKFYSEIHSSLITFTLFRQTQEGSHSDDHTNRLCAEKMEGEIWPKSNRRRCGKNV